jgi:hypothetical protein
VKKIYLFTFSVVPTETFANAVKCIFLSINLIKFCLARLKYLTFVHFIQNYFIEGVGSLADSFPLMPWVRTVDIKDNKLLKANLTDVIFAKSCNSNMNSR